ncbi:MAG: glutamate-1-semialdehyde 2,1-aminomutase [Peptococcaceae bacterium]|jgi:glutamate-1-semialdehyde 2,1-aminomutase|nr:glutamate-1-semialdehyde 2,1-aminomutase [Peptococcaceae bacterium]MBQ5862644.1 glutamate-1-semialdehyde 2,1-aminomutase [Peptococcaceae bacterium]
MEYTNSKQLFEEACELIPGGVNSPVRAFKAVGDHPVFIERGEGAYLYDVDGNKYVDYICSWGPLLLGHQPEAVSKAVMTALTKGSTYGAPTGIEVEMAKKIVDAVPSVEMVRMVSSGTEATMSALRLARGYTGRNKIVKFEGCYHGHADHLLIKAGSGALTFGVPSSPGVPESIASETLTAQYNDIDSVKALFAQYPGQIAAVIVEPIAGNMGLVLPKEGFLEGLREVTAEHGALLIFDEVISGFRASFGGAQKVYNIMPDLTCMGKIIGGGLPVGAYGGKKEIMMHVAPVGPVYQAGTLSGNPLAMAAGMAILDELAKPGVYEAIEAKTKKLVDGLRQAADQAGVKVSINHSASLFTIFFTETPVDSYAAAMTSNTEQFKVFFQSMLDQGYYLPPSQFECWFVSQAHSDEDIANTILAAEKAFQAVANM